jgi:hypothetical protein
MFTRIVLGHFVADYLLQSKTKALKKSEKGINGIIWCTSHSLIYTATICLFLWRIDWLVALLVFISHWPIDRWSLVSKWLKLIKGRDILAAYNSKEEYREIDLSFSCLVYAVADNTVHLVILWIMSRWLF